MNEKQIFEEIGLIDTDLILDAMEAKKVGKEKTPWVKYGGMVACFVLILGLGVSLIYNMNSGLELNLSSGNIKAKYVKNTPYSVSNSLIELTEEEIFAKYNTWIFEGTVAEIKNIEIDFNGSKSYRAIAKIVANKIFRGDIHQGDTVTVLLPCSIGTGVFVTDTETVSGMSEGMKGIFMPEKYDENSHMEQNNAKFYFKDVADCGFLDGSRFAFLETDQGLIFDKRAFQSISDATTLEEIENYVYKMIK